MSILMSTILTILFSIIFNTLLNILLSIISAASLAAENHLSWAARVTGAGWAPLNLRALLGSMPAPAGPR